MKGVWIAGTDTGIGKTHIAANLLAYIRTFIDAIPMKPVQTGSENNRAPDLDCCLRHAHLEPTDNEYSLMCPYLYKKACSPHLAASIENHEIAIDHITACAHTLWKNHDFLIIEGAGGLLVPINTHQTMLDLMKAIPLPVILVARGGLGTINHTLLSIKALQTAKLPIAGVILNDALPQEDDCIRQDNPSAISLFGNVNIIGNVHFGVPPSGETYERIWHAISNAS